MPDLPPTPVAPTLCPHCKNTVSNEAYFCPTCGKKIKDPPASTTIGAQVKIYLICIFAPPFGLIPGIKYLRSQDDKAKLIGIAAIILTIIATILTTIWTINFFQTVNAQISKQLTLPGY